MNTGRLAFLIESRVNVRALLHSITGPPKKDHAFLFAFCCFKEIFKIDNICDFEKRDHFVKTAQKHPVTVYIPINFSLDVY